MQTIHLNSSFWDWLGQSTVQVSVLIGLILLIQLGLKKWLSVRWRYALWLLLVLRMILPWSPPSRISMFNLLPNELPVRQTVSPVDPANLISLTLNARESETLPPWRGAEVNAINNEAGVSKEASELETPVTEPGTRLSLDKLRQEISKVLPLVWLVGAGVLGGYIAVSNIRLWRTVKRQRPLTRQGVLELLEDCKTQMNIQTVLAVVATDEVKSPALFGFVRPRLLIPAGMLEALNEEELKCVFLHELAHLKRHDIAMGWLTSILLAMHWFNPLVWLAFSRMRADRELVCDALALTYVGEERRPRYGRTILRLLEHFAQRRRMPSMAGILESKTDLKRRITMIAQFKKGSYRWTIGAVLLIAALSLVTLTNAQEVSSTEKAADKMTDETKKQITKEELEGIVKQAVTTISTCTETDQKVVTALKTLQELDNDAVVKELIKYLDSDKNTIRRSAIYVLWKGNLKSIEPAADSLQKLCVHEEYLTRGMAALALGGGKVASSFDTLADMTLKDSNNYARRCAAYALGLLGNVQAKPVLEKALTDTDIQVRKNAEAAITMLSQHESNVSPEQHLEKADQVILKDSFEQGAEAPAGWEKRNVVNGVEYIWDKNQGSDGTASLCLKKTANKYFPIAQWTRKIEHKTNDSKLAISTKVKAENVTKAILDTLFLDENDKWIKHEWVSYIGQKKEENIPPANHDWKTYSGVAAIPENTKTIVIGLQMYGPGTVWFDDLEVAYLKEIDKAKSKQDKLLAEGLTAEGWQLWGQRKLAEAEEKFKEAVGKDPTNDGAYQGLGWSQLNQGKKLNAKVSFEKSIEINSKNSAALNGLGWIAKGQGKTDEAIEYWQKAIAAVPQATAAWNGLATTYMETQQYDKAVEIYQKWLLVEADNKEAQEGLAKAQAQITHKSQ